MKTLFIGLLALHFLNPSELLAGIEGGHGGDLISCTRSNANNLNGDYFLDYVLTHRTISDNTVQVNSWEESKERILRELNRVNPLWAESFESFANDIDNFDQYDRSNVWEEKPFGVINIQDENITHPIPTNCLEMRRQVVMVPRDQDATTSRAQSDAYLIDRYGTSFGYIEESNGSTVTTRYTFERRMVPTARLTQLIARHQRGNNTVFDFNPIRERLRQERPLQFSFAMVHEWLWSITEDVEKIRGINRFLHTSSLEATRDLPHFITQMQNIAPNVNVVTSYQRILESTVNDLLSQRNDHALDIFEQQFDRYFEITDSFAVKRNFISILQIALDNNRFSLFEKLLELSNRMTYSPECGSYYCAPRTIHLDDIFAHGLDLGLRNIIDLPRFLEVMKSRFTRETEARHSLRIPILEWYKANFSPEQLSSVLEIIYDMFWVHLGSGERSNLADFIDAALRVDNLNIIREALNKTYFTDENETNLYEYFEQSVQTRNALATNPVYAREVITLVHSRIREMTEGSRAHLFVYSRDGNLFQNLRNLAIRYNNSIILAAFRSIYNLQSIFWTEAVMDLIYDVRTNIIAQDLLDTTIIGQWIEAQERANNLENIREQFSRSTWGIGNERSAIRLYRVSHAIRLLAEKIDIYTSENDLRSFSHFLKLKCADVRSNTSNRALANATCQSIESTQNSLRSACEEYVEQRHSDVRRIQRRRNIERDKAQYCTAN